MEFKTKYRIKYIQVICINQLLVATSKEPSSPLQISPWLLVAVFVLLLRGSILHFYFASNYSFLLDFPEVLLMSSCSIPTDSSSLLSLSSQPRNLLGNTHLALLLLRPVDLYCLATWWHFPVLTLCPSPTSNPGPLRITTLRKTRDEVPSTEKGYRPLGCCHCS